MKISAVIPAYNSARFIADAVHSILAQTVAIDEIIIIDDGSTDDTEDVVKQLPGNIIYQQQSNQGPSAARNHGIRLAKGDWIAFLDADDQWTPHKIERQQQVLTITPSLKLIAGDMAEIDLNDRLIVESVQGKHHLLETFQTLAGAPIPNALAKLVNKNFIPTGTVLAKREILSQAGLFNPDTRYGEDLELWAKIAAYYPITCLPDVLMLRRQHNANATQASEKMLRDLTQVMESLRRQVSPQLKAQGVDPQQLVADAYRGLGYWYFVDGNQKQAGAEFFNSLKNRWTWNVLCYLLATQLPQDVIGRLRSLKQKLTGA